MDDTQPRPQNTAPAGGSDDTGDAVAEGLEALAEADPVDAPEIAERLAATLGDALDRERPDPQPR